MFLKVNSGADGGWVDMEGTSAVGLGNLARRSLKLQIRLWSSLRGLPAFWFKGMCVVVSKVELESAVALTSTQIWSGECVFGNWAEGFNVPAEKFADASAGDILEFVYTTDTNTKETWWQFKTIFSGTEETLSSNKGDLNEYGCASVASSSTSYKIVLNAEDIAKLKETGCLSMDILI